MKNSIQTLLVTALVGLPTFAVSMNLPANCKTVVGAITLGATFVTADFSNIGTGLRTLPLARDVIFGKSPDTGYHICILYSAFGDEEIRYILTPTTN